MRRFSAATEALSRRLRALAPATEPFELGPGRQVISPKVFHETLLAELRGRPEGPEWRESALRKDLEAYVAHLESIRGKALNPKEGVA